MTESDPRPNESIDIETPRAQRALTECMTVLPEGGDVYTVVGEHGRTYVVDAQEGRCTCPDAEYNLEGGERCKHEIRTLVAEGHVSVPAWVDRGAVDGLLGAHVEGSPRLVATDGGVVWCARPTTSRTPARSAPPTASVGATRRGAPLLVLLC